MSSNQDNGSTNEATPSTTSEPGGLFGYIQSRKKIQQQSNTHNQASNRMQYHKFAQMASNYPSVDVMSDSDDDEPIKRDNISPPPIFDTLNTHTTSSSWFSTFQKPNSDTENKSIKTQIEMEDSSWLSQARRTMDDVTTKATDWLSSQTDSAIEKTASSTWDLTSSISSHVSSWSLFSKDNNDSLPTIYEDDTGNRKKQAFLPRIASRARLSFATKGINPFHAVIGRDTDYLLSSSPSYYFGSNSYFSWIKNRTLRFVEATDIIERPKSQPSEASIQAVKNLLLLVETEESEFQRALSHSSIDSSSERSLGQKESYDSEYEGQSSPARPSPVWQSPADSSSKDEKTNTSNNARNAEMASRLAEGTLRAYRDLVLDEAVELHSALHYWTLRWERPFLGWLEAGPRVWMSEEGHSPYEAARKMSQIQAVLARRCASVGDIQQHIWRATSRHVANWGMLGSLNGGEWVSVVGGDGGMDDMGFSKRRGTKGKVSSINIFDHPSLIGTNVTNAPGGRIVIDEDAQVTWSIDAMRVIRDQLYRASLGVQALPHASNWPHEQQHFSGDENHSANNDGADLPVWAHVASVDDVATHEVVDSEGTVDQTKANEIDRITTSTTVITDLPKMSEEVRSLLEAIEINLYEQRKRRLERLKPPSRLRRNWYWFAIGVPATLYIGHKLTKEHGGFYVLNQVLKKVADIYRDHVSEPLHSIYQELVKGRADVTDRKARLDAIESLKRMIRAWLDENYPKMEPDDRAARAEAMDISLIEEHMEESIKYIYEAPALVRMSLIEMQFIKKELLSALVAMDELMGSNEMNMQVAAMTPAVIFFMAVRRTFSFLFYSIFREGRSRDDVYATVRQTILDIERLLVMRDSPPVPPDSLDWGSNSRPEQKHTNTAEGKDTRTLSADDLGMLLLHIHECRQIIWGNRRRFRGGLLRNLTEDLAELAGERGPVSLTQQLQIVNRMSRVYLFMKPRSTFVTKL